MAEGPIEKDDPASIEKALATSDATALLRSATAEELAVSAVGECQAVFEHYAAMCAEPGVAANRDETPACDAVHAANNSIAHPPPLKP